MKRKFDVCLVLVVSALLLIPAVVIGFIVYVTSPGPVLYWSDRVGRHNRLFTMPKFRSMRVDAPTVATHLLTDPAAYLTPTARICVRRVWTNCRSSGASSKGT